MLEKSRKILHRFSAVLLLMGVLACSLRAGAADGKAAVQPEGTPAVSLIAYEISIDEVVGTGGPEQMWTEEIRIGAKTADQTEMGAVSGMGAAVLVLAGLWYTQEKQKRKRVRQA